ncbi:MAG TPA: GntR family transcriptional regulator [Bacteroidia bacterium]|nr:GntR family transcriptional regulator [Bacteroidia bacterium]
MEFLRHKPIFEQIAEMICKKIIEDAYPAGERIPSVRELAGVLSVNPNTVVAAYNLLADKNIIVTQRGIGYITTTDAKSLSKKYLENILVNDELKRVLKELKDLGIKEEQIIKLFREI